MINVKEEIIKNSDPKYKEFHKNIVPGIEDFYGVRMPVLRNISKQIINDDWRSFLEQPVTCYEETMIRSQIIAGAKMNIDERLELSRMFMPEINNWAICDNFCGDWKVNNKDKEKLWNYCLELIETDDEFMMRVSAVMMLCHFLDNEYIDNVLSLMSTKYHPGYYYKMGAAWTLSFAYIKFPEKTETFIFANTLDDEIRNKSIQKICDSFRVENNDKERLKKKKKELMR